MKFTTRVGHGTKFKNIRKAEVFSIGTSMFIRIEPVMQLHYKANAIFLKDGSTRYFCPSDCVHRVQGMFVEEISGPT